VRTVGSGVDGVISHLPARNLRCHRIRGGGSKRHLVADRLSIRGLRGSALVDAVAGIGRVTSSAP
jgi:hypothetical protein